MTNHVLFIRRLLSALCLLLLLCVQPASSQISLQLGAGLGFDVASGDFSGTTVDYYNGTKYGFSNGYNFLAKARASVLGFSLKAEADYSIYSARGDAEPGQGSLKLSQKIFSLKAGPEFQFVSLPMAPLKPYAGMNVQLNRFSGYAQFNGTARVPSAEYTMNATSRFGLGFEAGLQVTLGPAAGLDFNISYNLMNIAGKEFTVIDPVNPRRSDSYVGLNDAADPLYSQGSTVHFVADSRSVHTLMFTVSYLFGI